MDLECGPRCFLKAVRCIAVGATNPEGIALQPQLAYYAHKCINCGECAAICPEHAPPICGGENTFSPGRNVRRAVSCEAGCLGNALRLYGRNIAVEEALNMVLEDRDFYGTDGGVTLSGGEPLMQAEFCSELLSSLKREGINTAVDTCGCIGWNVFEKVMPVTDMFLYDFKHADSTTHSATNRTRK